MTAYTHVSPAPQQNVDCVEILREDQIISPPEEVEHFWSRLPENPSKHISVKAIAQEWLTGCYNEHDAVNWLRVLKLYSCPTSADDYETMSGIARRFFDRVALPEPVSAPIQPPPPDLLRVTSQARQRRMAGAA